MQYLILASLLISTSYSLNIIVYLSLVSKSHLDFVSSLINSLVERGHEVVSDLSTKLTLQDLLLAKQNTLVTSNGSHKAKDVFTFSFPGSSPWLDVGHLKAPFESNHKNSRMFLEYVRVASQLCRHGLATGEPALFLRRKKYDIGITSDYDFCGYILFHHTGINTVASFTATNMLSHQAFSLGLPSPASCVTGNFDESSGRKRPDIFERAKRLVIAMRFAFIERPEFEELGNSIIRDFFGSDFPKIGDLLRNSDLMFVNTNELIEKPRPLSHKVKYIGGVALAKPKPLPKSLDVLLDISMKNVIFSFGTQYKLLGDEGSLFANASNVKLLEWLPQTDLLNDPRVVAFISHMGVNSYLEASMAGVPIIAIPLFADQEHNAHSGAYRGTTIIVKPKYLTNENVKNALKKIIYGGSYKENANHLSQMMRMKPENGRDQFIEWVEFAAANKNLHKILNLPGNDIGVLEYYCVDCILLFIFLCLFLFIVLRKTVSLLFRKVFKIEVLFVKRKTN